MGLRGEAAIVGYVELPPERMNKAIPAPFALEQWAELGAAALEDAGLPVEVVNGIVASHLVGVGDLRTVDDRRIPRCGCEFRRTRGPRRSQRRGDGVAGGRGRRAGHLRRRVCALPARYITPMSKKKPKVYGDALYFGSSSNQFGSPQAEFEIPYGNLGQNGPYGQVAQRYAAVYGYDERAMAKIVVDTARQRQPHRGCDLEGQAAHRR